MVTHPILYITLLSIIFLQLVILYEKYSKNTLSTYIKGIEFISVSSIIWIFFILVLAMSQTEPLALNNWGDFLAGYFAPILFIWLVYGVFLQKSEFGKVVENFTLQQKEFKDSVVAMHKQATQVEIQQLNTWFHRNVQAINNVKQSLLKNLYDTKLMDSIPLIKLELTKDYAKHTDYFTVFDDLKNIFDIAMYITKYLNDLQNNTEIEITLLEKQENENLNTNSEIEKTNYQNEIMNKKTLLSSIKDIQYEFNMLFGGEVKDIKGILVLVNILTIQSEELKIPEYSSYHDWFDNKNDVFNLLITSSGVSFDEKIKYIMENINSISPSWRIKNGYV